MGAHIGMTNSVYSAFGTLEWWHLRVSQASTSSAPAILTYPVRQAAQDLAWKDTLRVKSLVQGQAWQQRLKL